MFLAWRDLVVARGRFLLVGSVIALLALLSTLLSGLATGLVDDGISGLRALPVTHLAFQHGADSSFSRSTLTPEMAAEFAVDGVEPTPVGVSFVNATSARGTSIDVALFGVDPGGFLAAESAAPAGTAGRAPAPTIDRGLVLSDELRDEVEVGETFTIVGSDLSLPVVGFTFGGSYGHVPIAFTSLETWQRLVYGNDPQGRSSALALRVDPDAGVDLAAIDEAAGTETGTKAQAFDGSPGYAAETATMSLIRGFLLVISALVVGAFFTVWTVQRTRQIGLLKGLGASTRYVLRDALGQLAVVLVAAITAGTLAGFALGGFVSDDVPFSLSVGSVLASAALLTLVGMSGSLVAIRRIARVDPAVSLGVEA